MAFRVGQKVVCVDDMPWVRWEVGTAPVEGRIYTVREVGLTVEGEPGLRLHELELTSLGGNVGNFTRKPFRDAFYMACRFRPLVERKTSIEIFQRMLTPKKRRVSA